MQEQFLRKFPKNNVDVSWEEEEKAYVFATLQKGDLMTFLAPCGGNNSAVPLRNDHARVAQS